MDVLTVESLYRQLRSREGDRAIANMRFIAQGLPLTTPPDA